MTQALQVRRFSPAGEPDAHGNTAATYGDPESWVVRGLAPGAMDEPGNANRDLSLIEWTVYADANDSAPGERDLVLVDGDEFTVEGRPSDWTRGPWANPAAGLVIELRRAEG